MRIEYDPYHRVINLWVGTQIVDRMTFSEYILSFGAEAAHTLMEDWLGQYQ